MTHVAELTWDQVLSWRLDRHFLDRPPDLDPEEIVGRLAGVQAQVASSAQRAVAVRRAEATADVAAALSDRTLVKTWAMRGTLHLLRTDDAAAVLSVIASGRSWLTAPWQREFATAAQMDALADAVRAILPDATLTREELVRELADHTGDRTLGEKLGSGWGVLLKPLAWQGLLCHALPRDGRVTFTSPATWLPGWAGLPDPDDAARTVIPLYLAAHGPADPVRFGQWLTRGSLRRTVPRRWFAELTDAGVLTPVRVEGETLHARTGDVESLRAAVPTDRLRLLPGFDQFVLGPGTDDPRVLSPQRRRHVSRAAGWIAPVVVRGGRVVGTWDVSGPSLSVELFAEAGGVDRDALDAECAVLRNVTGQDLEVTVATV